MIKILIFILSLTIYSPLFAEEEEAPVVTDNFKLKNEGKDPLEQLVEIEPYKGRFESCQKAGEDNKLGDKSVGECIWEGSEDAGIPKLSQGDKEKAQQFMEYAAQQNGNRAPANADPEKKYEGVNIGRFETGKIDKALAKVKDFFEKKIQEAMYGEVKKAADKENIQVVDHAKFYDLYANRVSKNIVEAISSLCIDAEIVSTKSKQKIVKNDKGEEESQRISIILISSDPETTKKVRQKNVDRLKQQEAAKEDGTKRNIAYADWTACVGSLEQMCLGHIEYCDEGGVNCTDKKKMTFANSCTDFEDSNSIIGCSDSSIRESAQRSCAVTNYLKNARQSLLALAKVQDKWKEREDKNGRPTAMEATGCRKKDPVTGRCTDKLEVVNYNKVAADDTSKSIDSITVLTSNEAVDTSGFADEQKSIQEAMDRCYDKENKTIIDPEACKKFVGTDKKEKLKQLTEMELRALAMEEKLKGDKFDKDEVAKYLEEQGYDQAQINQQLNDESRLKKVKEEILAKYKAERENLIDGLRNQIKNSTIEGDEIDLEKDKDTIARIANEIQGRSEQFAQLVHYNNIVTGYLEVGKGENKRNTASLYAELNDTSETVVGKGNEQVLEDIRKVATEAGLSEPDQSREGTEEISIDVDTINKRILDYDNLDK